MAFNLRKNTMTRLKYLLYVAFLAALISPAHAQNFVQACDDPGAAARAPFANTACNTFAGAAPAAGELVLAASSPTYDWSATNWAVEDTLPATAWIWATDAGWVLKSQVAFPAAAPPPSPPAPSPAAVPVALRVSAAKTLFRFPKTQAGWNQAMLSAPGSVIFPIYDPDYVSTDYSYRDPLIDANIAAAQSLGLKVFAYVDGLNSEANSSLVEATITTWVTQLAAVGEHVDGVFIGDAGNNTGVDGNQIGNGMTYANYWINIIDWVHATYGVPVFIHPGGATGTFSDDQQILTVAESIVMFEYYFPYLASDRVINYASYPPPVGNGNPATGAPDYSAVAPQLPQTFMSDYNPSQFCAMTNGVAAADLANVENFFLANNVGYLYITDADEGATDTAAYWLQELTGLIQPP